MTTIDRIILFFGYRRDRRGNEEPIDLSSHELPQMHADGERASAQFEAAEFEEARSCTVFFTEKVAQTEARAASLSLVDTKLAPYGYVAGSVVIIGLEKDTDLCSGFRVSKRTPVGSLEDAFALIP